MSTDKSGQQAQPRQGDQGCLALPLCSRIDTVERKRGGGRDEGGREGGRKEEGEVW